MSGSQIVFGDNLNGGGLVFRTVQSSFLPDGCGSLLDGGVVSILTLNSPVPASVAVPMRLIDEQCTRGNWPVGYGLNGFSSTASFRWISMGWGEHHRPLRLHHLVEAARTLFPPTLTMEATATTPSEGAVRHRWNLRPQRSGDTWSYWSNWVVNG